MRIVFTIFILFFGIIDANSRSATNEKVLFVKSFEEDYRPLMCSHNIKSIIDKFKENQISLKDSYVVHVRPLNAPFVDVKAYGARGGFKRWSFHAFFIHEGLVFDMDFGEELKPIELQSYIEKMFFPKRKKVQNLLYQIKPATLYDQEDFDGTMNSNEYKLQNFNKKTLYF